jgi:hypothetical protein
MLANARLRVEQEFYGMMLAHRADRTLMKQAASLESLDPRRLSFSGAIRVIRRKLISDPVFLPSNRNKLRQALPQIAGLLVNKVKGREVPRGVECKMSGYPIKRGRSPTVIELAKAAIFYTK